MHRTLALRKGGRSISTRHGQRRILKYIPPVKEYIEKAVQTGVYRTGDEIDAAMEALRMGHSGSQAVLEPRVAVSRFRRDIIRGTEVQDYPPEYHILCQHPPLPVPPRTPKKILRRMQAAQPKHPTKKLAYKFMKRHSKSQASEEDYYKKLLGVQPPADNLAMGQKSASLSKAYVYAVKQYEVMRTQDVSEDEALDIVDKLLAEEEKSEGHKSRGITHEMKAWDAGGPAVDLDAAGGADEDEKTSSSSGTIGNGDLPSILHDKPRVVEGMMQWSRMLQESGIPYNEWTVGASTALDHWIARNILQLSEATWDSLLEGDDPSSLSRGQDIVAIRETLFPETKLEVSEDDHLQQQQREQEQFDNNNAAQEEDSNEQEPVQSVDALLKSLRGLDSTPDERQRKQEQPAWNWSDANNSSKPGEEQQKDEIQMLTEELQKWRAQHTKSAYKEWSEQEKQRFSVWMTKYLNVLTSDSERSLIDLDETRDALLSGTPQTQEESDSFWRGLQDETKADLFLQNLLQEGPPDGLTDTEKVFWTLPYAQQLEKLINLGAVRPLFDEYMPEAERVDFFRRYGDYLLDGVELDHLVPDPQGPVTGMDMGIEAIRTWGIRKEDRFRLVKLPYRSGLDGDEGDSDGDITSDGSDAALEQSRALFRAWNQHKAGRARYEETLFVRGDLGLSYGVKTANEIEKDTEEENLKK